MSGTSSSADIGIYLGQGDEAFIRSGLDICKLILTNSVYCNSEEPQAIVTEIFSIAIVSIGFIASISLIVSGLMLIFGGASESTVQKGKTGVRLSIVALVVVAFSFFLFRTVERIARATGN